MMQRDDPLIEAVRALIDAAAVGDPDADAQQAAIDLVDRARERIGPPRRSRVPRQSFEVMSGARDARAPWRTDPRNPVAPRLDLQFDDDGASAVWRGTSLHEGPTDSLHGGVSAYLLDIICGVVMQSRGVKAVTARLDISYRHRVPLDVDLVVRSRLVSTAGRKHVIRGEIVVGDLVAVEADGLFISI